MRLDDSVGAANPKQVVECVEAFRETFLVTRPRSPLHYYNARGMANAYAVIKQDSGVLTPPVGGLGGCSFAPPPSLGNVYTEGLAYVSRDAGTDWY